MDMVFVDYVDRTVDAIFDGELRVPSTEAEGSMLKMAGMIGDRLKTKLYYILETFEDDGEMPHGDFMAARYEFQGHANFNGAFQTLVWPNLSDQAKQVINNLGSTGGWMNESELRQWYKKSPYCQNGETIPADGVAVGVLNQTAVQFYGEGNLITVAPPGTGKGQCQVIPNLLTYIGGAFVLDIKGENAEYTQEARAKTFYEMGGAEVKGVMGPGIPAAMRFSPGEEGSACWNPLDFIKIGALDFWDDCQNLASLMIVPQAGDYWEEQAANLVSAIIQYVILSPDIEGNMREVCKVLWSGAEPLWDHFDKAKKLGNDRLAESMESFQGMADKEFSGVHNSAKRSLEIWRSPRVETVTKNTTKGWDLDYLKRSSATVYINVPIGNIRQYASVLRVLVGQHLTGIMSSRDHIARWPICFFLDEFPQLGYMKPIEDAVDIGRDTKIRLWLFCQNLGQIYERYNNAEGILAACNFQSFMNINDNRTAAYVERRLGTTGGSFLDNRPRPLASGAEMMGPNFENNVIVLGRGLKPIRADKAWLSDIPVLFKRVPEAVRKKYQK